MSRDASESFVRYVVRRQELPAVASYAGFVSRIIAMVIDLLILGTTWLMLSIGFDFVVRTSALQQVLEAIIGPIRWQSALQELLVGIGLPALLLLLFSFSYFAFFYGVGGASLGKYLMGLRVLRHDGRRLSGRQALVRTLAYALSALPVYLGFINILLDDRRRGWHDILAGTVVVHSWPARPDASFLRKTIGRLDQRRP